MPDQPAAVAQPVARAIAHVTRLATGPALSPDLRVTLNFHPDRLVEDSSVLAAMARDGVYRSQFETGTSNGGLTAHPGGDRWTWESRIFGGAYDDADGSLRPKYGALDRHRSPVGAAPRFGSAHVRLAPHTLAVTTFCFPDSVFRPEHFGVAAAYALSELADDRPALFPGESEPDPLDDYVEAHVHGVVDLASDVEALVLDPSFRGTEVEDDAQAWDRLGVPVEWHDGWVLPVEELRAHPDYRGPEFVELGEAVAVDGVLTPRIVGDAVRTGRHDPQHLKRVWHLVARFGRSSRPS